ncbi:MAG: hypothetical protein ABJA70_04230 [Chryseolinea sp.]
MKSILNLLTKVFVIQFYQSHVSLFLFVLGMSAGFMRAQDHLALGALMVSSPLLATMPIMLWIVYTILFIKFNSDLLSLPENRFAYALSFVEKKRQLTSITSIIAVQLAPAILYGAFLASLAWMNQQYIELFQIISALLILTAIGSLQFFSRIANFQDQNKQWKLTIVLNRSIVKPFPLFFPEWIARKELFVLLGTKTCGLILLYAITQLYKFDTYDVRLIALGTILCFAAQSPLIWNLHYFENQVMMMTRSMPLSFLKRLINLLITLCLLLLPESAFLVGRFPEQLSFYDLISSLTLGWSICILFYGFLYWKSFLLDELTTRIFFFVMALLVITLFKMPLLLISSVLFVTGFSLWIANYYRYEAGATYNTRDLGS